MNGYLCAGILSMMMIDDLRMNGEYYPNVTRIKIGGSKL